ncbi:MAG: hypothetical protein EOO84_22605 [Pantoea sp.]|uniref:class I tRNA ligase family protein n=1 Tax=Pantoea sp. TaxID=69393 RepID=UPI00120087ED|nr:class I tRNA ligase family protein [Pantoea sp.]RZK04274.1 MAG: hypothetical protein EOO84_22605 [Pantoea sp.]
MEDANFDRTVANTAVLSLYVEEECIREFLNDEKDGKLRGGGGGGDMLLMDHFFINEIYYLVEQTKIRYEKILFREALQHAWYEMLLLRDFYRDWCIRSNHPVHQRGMRLWVEVLGRVMQPIIPHWCEVMYELSSSLAGWSWFGAGDTLGSESKQGRVLELRL